jgi:hypothetical protein
MCAVAGAETNVQILHHAPAPRSVPPSGCRLLDSARSGCGIQLAQIRHSSSSPRSVRSSSSGGTSQANGVGDATMKICRNFRIRCRQLAAVLMETCVLTWRGLVLMRTLAPSPSQLRS